MHYEMIMSVYPNNCDYCLVLLFCTKNCHVDVIMVLASLI